MGDTRKQHTGRFKSQVVLAAIRGEQTMAELSSEYGVHASAINRWKREALNALPELLSKKSGSADKEQEELISRLYQEIGQLKVELDWLKKNLVLSVEEKRSKIDYENRTLPVSRQCELLGLSRSAYYYQPVISQENIRLMSLIDEEFTAHPFYGKRRICDYLRNQGEDVNIKRVARLMRLMGLEAIYPKPNLSRPVKWSEKYPYLLKGVTIDKPNQVWASDITYIRLKKGFVYLVAVVDWFSRYVLSWRLSNNLEVDFCVEALVSALGKGRPEIFNTDQGSQFTSNDFQPDLKDSCVKISLDGRGRAFDNIMVERLWRSVKYEEVYLRDYHNVKDAQDGLKRYFKFYNEERGHQTFGYQTPFSRYHSG